VRRVRSDTYLGRCLKSPRAVDHTPHASRARMRRRRHRDCPLRRQHVDGPTQQGH
jgi:hypothetical protein